MGEFIKGDAASATAHDRGACLEKIAQYIMGKIPGVRVQRSDVLTDDHSEEIDVVCWNDKVPGGLGCEYTGNVILIECKNWKAHVSAKELAHFATKLDLHRLKFGILVAANGLTGNQVELTAAYAMIANLFMTKGVVIVVLTRAELESLVSSEMFIVMLQNKVSDVVLRAIS